MKSIRIVKTGKTLKGVIRLPSSKSISNRLLIIRALSGINFPVHNLSAAGDTVLLEDLLRRVSHGRPDSNSTTELDCANAGTVLRFLASLTALNGGRWMLTGSERMKQRPVGELVETLKMLGAGIEYLGNAGFPPLLIKSGGLRSAPLTIDAGVSSQFISSLLLISPYLPDGLTIDMKGEPVSEPYIDMTIGLMKEFGISIRKWKHRIIVEPGKYTGKEFTVESDWSAASFWFLASSLTDDVDLTLIGLSENSLQGDSILQAVYSVFGVQSEFRVPGAGGYPLHELPSSLRLTKREIQPEGFYFDFTPYPDIALPVIAGCAATGIAGRFEGLRSLAIKESDRVRVLSAELLKLGCILTFPDGDDPAIELSPSELKVNPGSVIDTYRDHRMAMTFAMLALKTGSIRIADPDVTDKSYPGFWTDLEAAGFRITW